jgi:hypothetical protein
VRAGERERGKASINAAPLPSLPLQPYPCWSTDSDPSGEGGGNPDGVAFVPAETDFTLQNGDNWFYNAGAGGA